MKDCDLLQSEIAANTPEELAGDVLACPEKLRGQAMNSQTNDTPRSYGAPKSAGYESAWHARLLGVVGAVLLAELIWCGVALVAGLQLQAPATQTSAQPSSIGPIDVGVASVIASLVAWAVAFGF